jgi:Protein of unknown function (DUF995)
VTFKHLIMLAALAVPLAACSHNGKDVRFTNSAPATQQAEPIRALSASEIQAAISGKTFQYTRSDGNGFVTYNADGTFTFQDDAKGSGSGRWSVSNGQYCESYGQAGPQECGEFKATGDAYFAAKSRLVEMKV